VWQIFEPHLGPSNSRIAGHSPATAKAAVIPNEVRDLWLFLALFAPARMLVQTEGLVKGHDRGTPWVACREPSKKPVSFGPWGVVSGLAVTQARWQKCSICSS